MIKDLLNYACFTCKIGIGKESIALHNRDLHVSEGIYTRVYPNRAPAVLVECLKCNNCGHSWIPKTPKGRFFREISSAELRANRNAASEYIL